MDDLLVFKEPLVAVLKDGCLRGFSERPLTYNPADTNLGANDGHDYEHQNPIGEIGRHPQEGMDWRVDCEQMALQFSGVPNVEFLHLFRVGDAR